MQQHAGTDANDTQQELGEEAVHDTESWGLIMLRECVALQQQCKAGRDDGDAPMITQAAPGEEVASPSAD